MRDKSGPSKIGDALARHCATAMTSSGAKHPVLDPALSAPDCADSTDAVSAIHDNAGNCPSFRTGSGLSQVSTGSEIGEQVIGVLFV